MAGDSVLTYYRDFAFVFLKVVQAFFRGSIDNVDHESSSDKYSSSINPNTDKRFTELALGAYGSYSSIVTSMSTVGYTVVS